MICISIHLVFLAWGFFRERGEGGGNIVGVVFRDVYLYGDSNLEWHSDRALNIHMAVAVAVCGIPRGETCVSFFPFFLFRVGVGGGVGDEKDMLWEDMKDSNESTKTENDDENFDRKFEIVSLSTPLPICWGYNHVCISFRKVKKLMGYRIVSTRIILLR